jgi:hypothetical protein
MSRICDPRNGEPALPVSRKYQMFGHNDKPFSLIDLPMTCWNHFSAVQSDRYLKGDKLSLKTDSIADVHGVYVYLPHYFLSIHWQRICVTIWQPGRAKLERPWKMFQGGIYLGPLRSQSDIESLQYIARYFISDFLNAYRNRNFHDILWPCSGNSWSFPFTTDILTCLECIIALCHDSVLSRIFQEIEGKMELDRELTNIFLQKVINLQVGFLKKLRVGTKTDRSETCRFYSDRKFRNAHKRLKSFNEPNSRLWKSSFPFQY